MQALLFDLGGTHLRSAVLSASGAVRGFESQRVVSLSAGATGSDIWSAVIGRVARYEAAARSRLSPAAPIVMAFPGPIMKGNLIVGAPTLTGDLRVPDLAAEIRRATGREVYLLNDVSAAAWRFAEVTAASRFMVVTVSSGIGAKIFDREHNRLVLDSPAYAGEIGHFTVDDDPEAAECDCGARGHLGAIASGRGVERAARRRAAFDPGSFARSALGLDGIPPALLTNEDHIVPACLAGDLWALELVRDCTMPLSRALVTVMMAAGLDSVIMIGGFAQALGDIYLDMVCRQVAGMSSHPFGDGPLAGRIAITSMDEQACLLGCAAYARHALVWGSD